MQAKSLNAAFWKWFGDSAATDEDGNPLLLYHGTPYGGFSEFSTKAQSIGFHGVGIYLTDSAKAAERYGFDRYYEKDYKGDPFRKAIVPVYASIQRCFDQRRFYTADEIDSIVPESAKVRKSDWNSSFREMKSGRKDSSLLNRVLNWIDSEMGGEVDGRRLIQHTGILEKEVGGKRFQERVSDQQPVWARDWGLDGIIVLDAISARGGVKHVNRADDKRKAINNLTVIVKDSKQIKSAIGNDGTYDVDDPDIRSNPKRLFEPTEYMFRETKGLFWNEGGKERHLFWEADGKGKPHHDAVIQDQGIKASEIIAQALYAEVGDTMEVNMVIKARDEHDFWKKAARYGKYIMVDDPETIFFLTMVSGGKSKTFELSFKDALQENIVQEIE